MTSLIFGVTLAICAPTIKEPKNKIDVLGVWELESTTRNGNRVPQSGLKYGFTKDNEWQILRNDDVISGVTRKYTLDSSKNPANFDLVVNPERPNPTRYIGIAKVEGDTMTVCYRLGSDAERPKTFESTAGNTTIMWTLKRVKSK